MMPAAVEYRDIPGFVGYRVGSDGSVWSRRNPNGRGLVSSWRKLKPLSRNGYLFVSLAPLDGPRKKLSLHRLILEVFVGRCPAGMEACHYPDDDRHNNRLENLRWDTKKANHQDRREHGKIPMGVKHYRARLSEANVVDIRRRRKAGETLVSLATEFGVTKECILAIYKRRIWKHVA